MKKLLMAAATLSVLACPAYADVILDTNGQGGTGDNVIFNAIANSSLVLGSLNGQHNEIVRFRDLSGNPNFTGTGGQNGNDIKLFNTANLDITVFDSTDITQVTTSRDIFSLKGTGTVFFHVTALEGDGTTKIFNFGSLTDAAFQLSNGQSGFDLKAINGESIKDIDVFVSAGGVISDFEHYRIDVATVPAPIVGAGLPGLLAGLFGLVGLNRLRRRRTVAA
jgi:hypothetical protein